MPPTEEQTYREFLGKRLDKQDKALDDILKQTTKTNGRVTKLETDKEIAKAVQDSQQRMIRGLLWAVIGLCGFIIANVAIPILSAYIQAGRL